MTIEENSTVLISTDSQALYKIFKSLIENTATVSEILKSPSGHMAESFRHIIWNGRSRGISITLTWKHNEHSESYDSDDSQDLEVRNNHIADKGAD